MGQFGCSQIFFNDIKNDRVLSSKKYCGLQRKKNSSGKKSPKIIGKIYFMDIDLVAVSYEDKYLEKIKNYSILDEEQMIGADRNKTIILILRDPYNLFASRLKYKKPKKHAMQNKEGFVEKWKSYALEFLGDTNIIDNKICINYNSWLKDIDYRRDLSKRLGGDFSDSNIDIVPSSGGGSSFDRKSYDGRASEMKLLERWKSLKNEKYFLELVDDKELAELSFRIFGNIMGDI
jgi:hypothetical protein